MFEIYWVPEETSVKLFSKILSWQRNTIIIITPSGDYLTIKNRNDTQNKLAEHQQMQQTR